MDYFPHHWFTRLLFYKLEVNTLSKPIKGSKVHKGWTEMSVLFALNKRAGKWQAQLFCLPYSLFRNTAGNTWIGKKAATNGVPYLSFNKSVTVCHRWMPVMKPWARRLAHAGFIIVMVELMICSKHFCTHFQDH